MFLFFVLFFPLSITETHDYRFQTHPFHMKQLLFHLAIFLFFCVSWNRLFQSHAAGAALDEKLVVMGKLSGRFLTNWNFVSYPLPPLEAACPKGTKYAICATNGSPLIYICAGLSNDILFGLFSARYRETNKFGLSQEEPVQK